MTQYLAAVLVPGIPNRSHSALLYLHVTRGWNADFMDFEGFKRVNCRGTQPQYQANKKTFWNGALRFSPRSADMPPLQGSILLDSAKPGLSPRALICRPFRAIGSKTKNNLFIPETPRR
ncbi:hypothetical protein CYPRO_2201 [Cyclonatronum proteinivorum]|uniref:Uncharacterized protein n=1 Tax=Cyclonatronum proteinivorum TaxID=1457365 RepID=A0A345ULU7_9BACT|nr:hypothetical protein CYPRO_2201 [Cyclonatronum proteinivorum]